MNYDSINIPLDGCALRTNPDYPYLDGWDPYDHQRETAELFDNHDQFFGMNTAPTGGGKTASWAYAVLKDELDTIALYPRNSLITDQKQSLEEFAEDHYPETDVNIVDITSDTLNEYREDDLEQSASKGDTLSRRLRDSFQNHDCTIMLTNPHIFVQMYHGAYKNTNVKRELKHFEVAVSDEFHICRIKERNTLLDIFSLMYRQDNAYTKLSKVLFLSATPEPALRERLANHMDVNFHYIDSTDGKLPLEQVDANTDCLSVVPPVDLQLRCSDTFQTFGEMFGDDQLADTLQFCRAGGRVLIMLDGFNEVNHAYDKLNAILPSDITIHKISGFADENKQKKLNEFDLLVSNSAVEVGIDFDVDRLIFSAPDAASLIQRLGRLRNKVNIRHARCYVPEHVMKAFANLPETPNNRVTRRGFEYVVRDSHYTSDPPESFSIKYSAPEAFAHAMAQSGEHSDFTASNSAEFTEEVKTLIKRNYYDPAGIELDTKELYQRVKKLDDGLLDQLQLYGANSINTLVYDTVDNMIKTYSPFALIRNAHVTFVPEDEFYANLPTNLRENARSSQTYTDGFCIYHGPKDADADPSGKVGLTPSPYLRDEIGKPVTEREPIASNGLHISVEDLSDAPGLKHLNAELATREFICYPANGNRYDIKTHHGLDPFFFMYDLRDVRDDVSVALGHNALYLHCYILEEHDMV